MSVTIADKLIAAAQNEQRIYKKGYDKGVAEGGGSVSKPEVEGNYNITANGSYSYTPPADKVFSKVNVEVAVSGGTEDLNDVLTVQEEKIAELSAILDKKADDGSYDEGYADGFEDGKAEGGSQGFDPLYYITKIGFEEVAFPDNTHLVLRFKTPPRNPDAAYRAFYKTTGVTHLKIITDDTDMAWTSTSQMFRENGVIEVIDLTECSRKFTAVDYMFMLTGSLKIILGALDVSQCPTFNQSFTGGALEEVRFVPYSIKTSVSFRSGNLTPASLDSIIDGLADLTGGTAQTLGLDQAGKNLTEDQKARIAAKNWTYTHW